MSGSKSLSLTRLDYNKGIRRAPRYHHSARQVHKKPKVGVVWMKLVLSPRFEAARRKSLKDYVAGLPAAKGTTRPP